MSDLFTTGTEIIYDGDKKITVRRLNVSDVFKFAKLLGKVGTGAFAQLSAQFNVTRAHAESEDLTDEQRQAIEKQQKSQAQQLGFTLFATLADHETEFLDFLASLANMSLADFKLLPPDVALDVVAAVAQGEDLKRFFDKARALSSKLLPNQVQAQA